MDLERLKLAKSVKPKKSRDKVIVVFTCYFYKRVVNCSHNNNPAEENQQSYHLKNKGFVIYFQETFSKLNYAVLKILIFVRPVCCNSLRRFFFLIIFLI